MKKIMNILLVSAFGFTLFGYVAIANAHDAAAVMDPDGIVPGFTAYARTTCSAATNGTPTDYLTAKIKDRSPPQDGMFVSVQIIGPNNAANATDPISGDDDFSPEARVYNGNGNYLILINKTAAGARDFQISYHCWSDAIGDHTPQSEQPFVYQFE